jgi:hypothetical protein
VVKLLPLRHVADLLSVNAAVGLGLTWMDKLPVSLQPLASVIISLMDLFPEVL